MDITRFLSQAASFWWLLLIRGLAGILFGILVLTSPGAGLFTLVLLFGFYAMVDGITALSLGIPKRYGLIFAGILSILAGIAAFARPMMTALALLIVISAWAIALGAAHLYDAFTHPNRERFDWFMAIAGAAAIALGVVLIINPARGLLSVVIAAGIYALISGAAFIAMAINLHQLRRRAHIVPA